MRSFARLCVVASVVLATACAGLPNQSPTKPAPLYRHEAAQGALAGVAACFVLFLWAYPPACGASMLLGGTIGMMRAAERGS